MLVMYNNVWEFPMLVLLLCLVEDTLGKIN